LKKETVFTGFAPKPIGPYSMAIRCGDFLFVSGQLGIDCATGELEKTVAGQTKRALDNVKAILEAGNCGLERVLKTTVFLNDMKDFGEMNEVYGAYFAQSFPARSAIEVSRLPKDALVEIEVIAAI
jgi:2-iminobutanoate/2-iminopropanoate deaminase